MSALSRKSAVLATAAVLAFSGIAAPVAAGNKGHHKMWTTKQCTNQAKRWEKAHKHPTAKQILHENKLLARHGCTNTV